MATGCVANCSGHGVCSGSRSNDTCLCDFGYGGAGCGDILLTQYVDTRLLLSGGCAGNCSGVSRLEAICYEKGSISSLGCTFGLPGRLGASLACVDSVALACVDSRIRHAE